MDYNQLKLLVTYTIKYTDNESYIPLQYSVDLIT